MEKEVPVLASGHRACAGCGQLLAARHVLEAAGRDVIVVNSTGCLEVTTTPWPESAFGVPWIHSLFENTAAVASGVVSALRIQGNEHTKVIAQGGDGSTFDIGFGLVSGSWERDDDVLYVCYDNEGYMNTGYQSSGSTGLGASTSTAPAGNKLRKKNLPMIALAHGVQYVATASVADVLDLQRKVKRALEFKGSKYLQVMVPCIPGWKIATDSAIELARIGVQSGLYPIFEAENGKIIKGTKRAETYPKVEEFLSKQGRFKHLFGKDGSPVAEVAEIQKMADRNAEWLAEQLNK